MVYRTQSHPSTGPRPSDKWLSAEQGRWSAADRSATTLDRISNTAGKALSLCCLAVVLLDMVELIDGLFPAPYRSALVCASIATIVIPMAASGWVLRVWSKY